MQDAPPPSGDSLEQREAEEYMRDQLSLRLGRPLHKARFRFDNGASVEVDGVLDDPFTLVEIWAHVGPPKSAQRQKVSHDILKLMLVERRAGRPAKKLIVMADPVTEAHFRGRRWIAEAMREFGITLLVVEVPTDMRARLLAAQRRQYR